MLTDDKRARFSEMNLQAAAHRLGVHYQTAYRWVREGRLVAQKLGGSYEVDDGEVIRFLAARALPIPPPSRAVIRNWTQHVDRLIGACLAGEELEARSTVERLFDAGVTVLELCEELLAPCMLSVGSSCQLGQIAMADEHRSATILERIAARLATHPRGRPRGVAVVCTAPGDLHGFPATLAALVLMEDHWKVHHLGHSLPADEIVGMAYRVNADLVVVSTAYPQHEVACEALRSALVAQNRRVLVGGSGRRLVELRDLARCGAADLTPLLTG